jgi:protoheme IX farnesyltransferase
VNPATLRRYYYLTKPGIIYGNALTAAAGFLLAADWHIDWFRFVGLLLGMSLVIGAACVCNNYLDRNIDQKMERTSRRALVSGKVSVRAALIYAVVLFTVGQGLLLCYTNWLTVMIGLIAFIDYVALYGWAKRHSPYGTLIGTISGSAPITAGYTAVTGHFDTGALLLFLLMVCWQMSHFYAIALYRFKDYKAAGLPVMPVAKGAHRTKVEIIAYILAFEIVAVLLTLFHYTGLIYLVVMVGIGAVWLLRGLRGFRAKDNAAWGKQMFLFSLIVVLVLSVMTALGGWLP